MERYSFRREKWDLTPLIMNPPHFFAELCDFFTANSVTMC